ncbi:MAG: hypothetical protein ACI35O_04095 [Bacillaceae bacterium]
MKAKEMIKMLQSVVNEHGDLEIYDTDGCSVFNFKQDYFPRVCKIYIQKR